MNCEAVPQYDGGDRSQTKSLRGRHGERGQFSDSYIFRKPRAPIYRPKISLLLTFSRFWARKMRWARICARRTSRGIHHGGITFAHSAVKPSRRHRIFNSINVFISMRGHFNATVAIKDSQRVPTSNNTTGRIPVSNAKISFRDGIGSL